MPAPEGQHATYLPIAVVACRLTISKATLYSWVCRKKGPPAIKFGGRVVFDERMLQDWIDAQPRVGGRVIAQAAA